MLLLFLDHKGHKGRKAFLGHKAFLGRKDPLGRKEYKDQLVLQDRQEPLDQ
ncbi:hypothetical protein J31TS3_04650 [Paenibacillus lactis]|jgi:hypothetical protein|nr:hypothetical protein J31TS3_04650 [Paenibacillus lactis]